MQNNVAIFGVGILKEKTNAPAKVEICATLLYISCHIEIYVYIWCTYIDVMRKCKKKIQIADLYHNNLYHKKYNF